MVVGQYYNVYMAAIYIILAVFACVLVALFLNKLYKRTNDYHNLFVDTSKFSNDGSLPDNLQLVNLGSNHPKFGFDYDGLDVKAMNWAVGPQSLEYDFAILRKGYHHLAPDAVVLIPICVLKFFLYRHPFPEQRRHCGLLREDDVEPYQVSLIVSP